MSRVGLVMGGLACAAAPWPDLWLSDLLASVALWAMAAGAALAGALALTRLRWWALLPLALVVSLGTMVLMAPRAPAALEGRGSITLLVLNARAAALEPTLAFLREHPADVAVLVEAPWDVFSSAPEDAGYRSRVAYGPQSGPGARVVLSQWPCEAIDSGLSDNAVFAVQVNAPDGVFAVVAAHAESPRTVSRWRTGNRRAREAVELAGRIASGGAPTLIAGDFNSPPTGQRSFALGQAGFRRAKPLWLMGGSYPAWAPQFAGLAIGGVAVGPEFSVASWRLIRAPGSDHRAVLIRLALEGH